MVFSKGGDFQKVVLKVFFEGRRGCFQRGVKGGVFKGEVVF